jgi:C4-type Zn-finger protein
MMEQSLLQAGRYAVVLVATDEKQIEFEPYEGEIELLADGSLHGSLTEGPILEGSWNTTQAEAVTFVLLYNGMLPFEYKVNPIGTMSGSWRLLTPRETLLPDEQGTLEVHQWDLVESADERAQKDLEALEGNMACQVKHISSVPVPCAVCGCDDTTSRLAFFELTIPHFGAAELMSFSCGECHYKHTKLRTTQEAKAKGVTLSLAVTKPNALDRTVVLTDTAVVRCPALETEMRSGTGRYTTVEGVLRGCATVLKSIGIASDGDTDESSVDKFIDRLDRLIEGVRYQNESFVLEIDDPLGLSFMDGATEQTWPRTPEQDAELGLIPAKTVETDDENNRQDMFHHSSSNIKENEKLMKACEAVAAEHTKEYEPTTREQAEDSEEDDGKPPIIMGDCD